MTIIGAHGCELLVACLSFFLLFALDAAGTTPLNGTSNETIDLYTKIDGKCAPTGGCLWSAYDCRCFRFFSCGTSWIDAEKQCLDYNGHLASVHTNAEYTFIQNLIKSQTRASTEAWIGGYGSVSVCLFKLIIIISSSSNSIIKYFVYCTCVFERCHSIEERLGYS
ncbi:snaclec botrocetin subunit alpha-like isoform X2 [Onychostoma macrolepis]|uniref:snaclec botrocetin subunit alpha-like isoform X2 n=1 Tax=Onychostoma macrolepis TaxID=369639 RepID=UPI00272BD989|nr:snaclec botrocetin subunit alpha-like isoform X2 [Onychostoma macrolepis]